MTEPRVGELISGPAAIGNSNHQAATTQTGQVVGHALPRHRQGLGKIRRMRRGIGQGQQDAGAGRVRNRISKARQHGCVREGFHKSQSTSSSVFTPSCTSLAEAAMDWPDFCAHSRGGGRNIRSHAGSHGRNGDWIHPQKEPVTGQKPQHPNPTRPRNRPHTTSPSNSEVHQMLALIILLAVVVAPALSRHDRRRATRRPRPHAAGAVQGAVVGGRAPERTVRVDASVPALAVGLETPGSMELGVSPCPGPVSPGACSSWSCSSGSYSSWRGSLDTAVGREHPIRVRVSGAARTGAVHCLGPFSVRTRSAREPVPDHGRNIRYAAKAVQPHR